MEGTPVKITGIELALKIIKKVKEEYDFSADTTEDYKDGWNDFSKIVTELLENMQEQENDKEPPKSVYQQMRERQAARYAWQKEV